MNTLTTFGFIVIFNSIRIDAGIYSGGYGGDYGGGYGGDYGGGYGGYGNGDGIEKVIFK